MRLPTRRIYSNGEDAERVLGPFEALAKGAARVDMASAFFTLDAPVRKAAAANKKVRLLVGLNAATSPRALRTVHREDNVELRFASEGFHAKFYLFDNHALLGSANLTVAGMETNSEAVIVLERERDADALGELEQLFEDLWDEASTLTDEVLDQFARAHRQTRKARTKADERFADALSGIAPEREEYKGYGKALREVQKLLTRHGLHRPALVEQLGIEHETGRFLAYVRQNYAKGEERWRNAALRTRDERRSEVLRIAHEWATVDDPQIADHFTDWLRSVEQVFGTQEALRAASEEALTDALLCVHTLYHRARYFRGGLEGFRRQFWENNGNDVEHVKDALARLLYGAGTLAERVARARKAVKEVGEFTALELYGTVHPRRLAPVNGRVDKALRYLGYEVGGPRRQLSRKKRRKSARNA